MRSLLYIGAFGVLLFGVISCRQQPDDRLTAEARALFEKSVKLTGVYTDSLTKAKDSTTVLRLNDAFESELTKLNFQYPADTDLDMDEGQNDTLSRLNRHFIEVRDSMLYYFAHHVAVPDTIPTDSIEVTPPPSIH